MRIKKWVVFFSVCFVSCSHNINDIYTGGIGGNEEEKINKEDFFDFSTIKNNQLVVDYGIRVQTDFYLYDEYPLELIGNTWEFRDIDPIYAGSTGEDGKFTSQVPLPSYLEKVWLVTNNVLVESPIELKMGDGGLTFNYNDYKAQLLAIGRSRASMNGILYPDGYDTIGEWNSEGIPHYLLADHQKLPSAFLKRCSGLVNSISTDRTALLVKFPELKTSGSNDMVITKATGLVATYLAFSSTSWEDMVAYYTYNEGETVDLATIKKTILIPRSSKNAPKSLIGEQVKLKYWNKTEERYEDEFPKGTHIGWILLGQGFGNETSYKIRYSNPEYNDNGQQHSVLLSDTEVDNCFFMGMEDNNDMRFNDVQFAITTSVPASVAPTPSIPDEVNKNEISYVVKGSLAYEDNWPNQGDYDMNDVVIYYSATIVKSTEDKWKENLVRTTTTFKPVNNGASFTNGFGFQLDEVEKKNISSVRVSQEGNIISESLEPEADRAVIIVFSDLKSVLNKPITVVIEYSKFNDIKDTEEVRPPYNPFIFVNKRSHEVHLPGYKPTSLVDESLRGTGNDLDKDDNGKAMYYISKDNMPFAINLSNVEFKWPSENTSITTYYPSFKLWKESNGASNKDWYLHSQ